MLPPVPKNQHYVWKHYLGAWARSGRITCRRQRAKKTFTGSAANVASETYFYRTNVLTDVEKAYLDNVIQSRPTLIRESHRGTLELFYVVTQMRQILDHNDSPDPENRRMAEELFAYVERSLGEQYHGAVERVGKPLLARLRKGDTTFWRDDDDRRASEFAYFIATQYTRTARMRNTVVNAAAAADVDIKRVWPIESHFWATEIGLALLANRGRYRALILNNESDVPFITGDQPTINLNPVAAEDVKLYYPVTPQSALLLTADPVDAERSVSRLEAESLNHAIYSWSDDQIYGLDEPYLNALAAHPKNP